MATRQEELQNLEEIHSTLKTIESIEQKIEQKHRELEKQSNRAIPNFHKYVPTCTLEETSQKARKVAEDKYIQSAAKNRKLCFLAFGLIALCELIFLLVGIFALEVNTDILFTWFPLFAISFALYAIPHAGMIIVIVLHFLVSFLYNPNVLSTDNKSPRDMMIISMLFLASAILITIVFVVRRIVLSKAKKNNEKYIQRCIVEYQEEEKKQIEKYEKEKELAEIEIAKGRQALSAEVAKNKRILQEELSGLNKSLAEATYALAQIPGLAPQDKNIYTVSTLITYFERGKADSIKEAINIFDLEERERARDSERRTAQFIADIERRAALDRMEREQYSHNQAMRDSARRMEQEQKDHNEKIQQELDDIKNGR